MSPPKCEQCNIMNVALMKNCNRLVIFSALIKLFMNLIIVINYYFNIEGNGRMYGYIRELINLM